MNSVSTFPNRTRRRQAREQNGKRAEHKEGLSSDDEETSTDITSFNLERGDQLNLNMGMTLAGQFLLSQLTIYLFDFQIAF